jgi:tetratricopeptide (TPR) repeat protein
MRTFLLIGILVSAGGAQRLARQTPLSTDERIASAQRALTGDAGNPALENQLASAYLQKMRETTDFSYVNRAEQLVKQALKAKPGDLEGEILKNEIELNRHHFKTVVENTERLVKTVPEDARLWGMMGDALMEIGDYDRAADAYDHMLKVRLGLSSYNRVSFYRFVTGDAEGAIKAMKQAVNAAGAVPENLAWCLVDLANLYFKTGRLDEAEASYHAALEAFPRYHPAFAGIGKVHAARKQWAEAVKNYSKAQAAVPLPEYAGALRELYLELGDKAEARKQEELLDVIDQLARANFENTDRTLAVVYADQGRHLDRALELAQNELAFRRDVYTYDALAWVLYKLKQYPEAQEAMKKALAWKTPEPSFQKHAKLIAAAAE